MTRLFKSNWPATRKILMAGRKSRRKTIKVDMSHKITTADYISVFKPGVGSRVTKLPGKGTINMTSGSIAKMAGPSSAQSEEIRTRSIDELQRELVEKAQKAGFTPEIKDMIDSIDEARKVLTKKNFELNILETLAMESTDENVSELREQLFTTVRLVHQDLVNEIMIHEYRDDALEPTSVYIDKSDIYSNRDNLIQKVRTWFYKRKEMREQLKQYKKNLKTSMDLKGY